MHKSCRHEIRFAGTYYASFSHEHRARERLNWLTQSDVAFRIEDRRWNALAGETPEAKRTVMVPA